MDAITRPFRLTLALALLLIPTRGFALQAGTGQAVPNQGPFGLQSGMTKEQVIQLVGADAVKENGEDSLLLTSAPRPHPSFELYSLIFSPAQGLLKLTAIGRSIQTSSFGNELHNSWPEIRDTVVKTYGEPKTFDYVRTGSLWKEREDWMMGLLKKERVLAAYWDLKSRLPNHISFIKLSAEALSTEKGYLALGYEFEGWESYVDSKKAKEGTVF